MHGKISAMLGAYHPKYLNSRFCHPTFVNGKAHVTTRANQGTAVNRALSIQTLLMTDLVDSKLSVKFNSIR
jgi:hypothetical protein